MLRVVEKLLKFGPTVELIIDRASSVDMDGPTGIEYATFGQNGTSNTSLQLSAEAVNAREIRGKGQRVSDQRFQDPRDQKYSIRRDVKDLGPCYFSFSTLIFL